MILFPALALDLELSRRVSERGLNPCGFLIANFLGQTNLGAPAGFLGLRLVNVLGTDGHVGENGDAISGDLHEAIANREEKSERSYEFFTPRATPWQGKEELLPRRQVPCFRTSRPCKVMMSKHILPLVPYDA